MEDRPDDYSERTGLCVVTKDSSNNLIAQKLIVFAFLVIEPNVVRAKLQMTSLEMREVKRTPDGVE